MLKSIIFICTLFASVNSIAQSKVTMQKEEYTINAQPVTKEKFNKLLSTLKEIPDTYSCAKTATGGRISYKVKEKKTGTMYMYGAIVDSNKSKYRLTVLLDEINTQMDEYKIDGKLVTEKEFNTFLANLKELPNTWFCKITSKGGCTGYSAKDKNDIIYDYRCCTENKISKCSLIKKELF